MPPALIRSRHRAARLILTVSLVVATVPLVSGATAVAADIATPMATKTAPASPPPYQWSGCYVGVNGGGGTTSSDFTTIVGPGTYLGATDAAEVNSSGTGSASNANFLGGGQAGCNWQSGTVVVGLEAEFDYFHDNANFYNNTNTLPVLGVPFVIGESLTTNYLATVRPRIGIAADRNFAYITGGVAFTSANYTESYVDATPASGSATVSKDLVGWVAGAGWEYAWTDHWIVRVEYLFSGFGTTNALGTITAPGVGSNPFHGSATDLTFQVIRGGLNFKF